MKSTVETLGPTRVRLAIEVPFAELEPTLKKAYREVAQQVNIPGFRRGRAPKAVIDQRVGPGVVLNEAVQEAIPQQLLVAIREHEVKTLGRPQVDNVEVGEGEPLKFTAELDVRPELELPELSEIAVTVDEVSVADEDVDAQLATLRERFATLKTVERAAAEGDYVQIDLAATVDGEEVEGGTASNLSHEVGSEALLPGLDEVLVGMSADESRTFTTPLVAGDHAGRDADVVVTVRTVKEKELPPLDDDFAELASEFDTLDELRDDSRNRLSGQKKVEQLYAARDKALDELIERAEVPAPDGVVQDEVAHRKQHMARELEQMGRTLADLLALDGKSEEELDSELTEEATRMVKVQLVLDTIAEAEEVQVGDEEFGQEVVRRAQQSGMPPQQYYDQLVQSGGANSVFVEVRRGKTLQLLLERVTITDSAGNSVSLDEVTGGSAAAAEEVDEEPAAAADDEQAVADSEEENADRRDQPASAAG
ncbi:trigger factor [Natronosporangium hydrolyticum]|uniref:Trigger factor n=1 Tax=Natronosporangium hydrolyticum TaxID=2811111 RepID=A0A895YMZ0_9ACTN|nr:trigger factor [Natronosporangium hydrolyticum]